MHARKFQKIDPLARVPESKIKLTRRFLLPISSRQIDESISIADFFPMAGGNDSN
jgi:hypothetical protein